MKIGDTLVNPLDRRTRRRRWLQAGLLAALGAALPVRAAVYPPVNRHRPLHLPHDEGSHPAFRTEWWYVTGWLHDGSASLGFQLTFFRTRPGRAEDNPSAFAAHQLLIGHAALADLATGHLLHAERIARGGFDLAYAREGVTDVAIDRWTLKAQDRGYVAQAQTRDFAFALMLTATQPALLNGELGFSRKGLDPRAASYYYSRPQLEVSGTLTRARRTARVTGTAWLDHEWSSSYVAAGATGWDWCGINLDDGGALMAFQMRRADGGAVWAGGTWRGASGAALTLDESAVQWTPGRRWRSPRTGVSYPVAWTLQAGGRSWTLEPLMDDCELDARHSTGTIYWEGPVRLLSDGRAVGRGYLELTGYWQPLAL